jgi:hypothetical protein
MESKDTMTLLDAIGKSAKCLTEFLKWSLKQTTKQVCVQPTKGVLSYFCSNKRKILSTPNLCSKDCTTWHITLMRTNAWVLL